MATTVKELCAAVSSCGLKYAQVEWDTSDGSTPPPLPYVLIVPTTSSDVIADGTNYARRTSYDVELYTRGRDMSLEGELEAALSAGGFVFERRHVPLGSGVLETAYTTVCMGR